MDLDAHKTRCQAAKATKLAEVLTRCGATEVVDQFSAPMWRMVVKLAEVNPHSAAEPVSQTVQAMVRALLQAQRDGILAFGPTSTAVRAGTMTLEADREAVAAADITRRVTERINASIGVVEL